MKLSSKAYRKQFEKETGLRIGYGKVYDYAIVRYVQWIEKKLKESK
jgi:hypothetical protein